MKKKKKHVHAICAEQYVKMRGKRGLECCFCEGHNCDKGAAYIGPIPKEALIKRD